MSARNWPSPWTHAPQRKLKLASAATLAAAGALAHLLTGEAAALGVAAAFAIVTAAELIAPNRIWPGLVADVSVATAFIAAGVPEAGIIAVRSVAIRWIHASPPAARPIGVALAAAGAFVVFGAGAMKPTDLIGLGFVAIVFYGGYQTLVAQSRSQEFHEREHDAFFRQAPVPMYRTSPAGAVLDVNEAMARFMGLRSPDQLIGGPGQVDRRYVEVEERHRWQRLMETDGAVLNYETRMRTIDGTEVTVLDSARAVRDADGSIRFYEGVLADISDLRATEAERERLAGIIDATSDMVTVVDEHGRISYNNQAARDWVARYVTDAAYTHLQQVFSPRQLELIQAALAETGTWSGDLMVAGREERYMNAVAQVFDSEDGLYVAAIGRDLTDEIAAASQLEALIKSKDEFIASVSHELRTPLTTVVGMSAELRDHGSQFDEAERTQFISLIADQAMEVADIVEDLLVAARKDTNSIVLIEDRCPVELLVARSLDSLPASHGKRIDVDVAGDVIGDPQRIRQILRNLLTNAIRYGGSTISVRTVAHGDRLHIDVGDNGSGIPLDKRELVFEAFERAHEAGTQPGSVGLGLSVSRWLATRMGGDLSYLEAAHGCAFRLTLPIAPPPEPHNARVPDDGRTRHPAHDLAS